MPRNK